MIDSYEFGKITVDGRSFRSDVKIYPDRVDASWWRKEGHNLCIQDIQDIIDYRPEVLIIGQGQPGLMKVHENIQEAIRKAGIKVYVSGTEKAVRLYNELHRKRKAVAALHLTC